MPDGGSDLNDAALSSEIELLQVHAHFACFVTDVLSIATAQLPMIVGSPAHRVTVVEDSTAVPVVDGYRGSFVVAKVDGHHTRTHFSRIVTNVLFRPDTALPKRIITPARNGTVALYFAVVRSERGFGSALET